MFISECVLHINYKYISTSVFICIRTFLFSFSSIRTLGFFYLQPNHPEIKTGLENAGVVVSVVYILLAIPILVFHRMIEYWDFSATCTFDICPSFLVSLLPLQRGNGDSVPTRRGCQMRSALRSAQYLPSYAQCTTNTFVAPSHTHVHIPATKGN